MRLPKEQVMYADSQSSQLEGQTGFAGHFRGDFGKSGREFQFTWASQKTFATPEFQKEFAQVIEALRAEDGCGLLVSRERLRQCCQDYGATEIQGGTGKEYGFRLKTASHTYLLRATPGGMTADFRLYVYASRFLEQHLVKAKNGIRFIDSHYRELFRLPDGGTVRILLSGGGHMDRRCRYIDDTHLEMGDGPYNLYHICQFAEHMEKNGNTVIPMWDSLPEKCFSLEPSTGNIIEIFHGGSYIPRDMSSKMKSNREVVDLVNGKLGISKAQEAAMLAGCLSGWQAPEANPANYDREGEVWKQTSKLREGRDAR